MSVCVCAYVLVHTCLSGPVCVCHTVGICICVSACVCISVNARWGKWEGGGEGERGERERQKSINQSERKIC